MAAIAVIATLAGTNVKGSGAAGAATPSADSRAQAVADRVTAPENCADARRGLAFYGRAYGKHLRAMGRSDKVVIPRPESCANARYLASVWRAKAQAARIRFERWHTYHWRWDLWLPDKWQRIGACETGYGKRPGRWDWNSGTYQGAFGFYHGSWDAFVPHADPKARPYPSEAYLATPRQQWEVALAIWRRYGFSGWGCRGA